MREKAISATKPRFKQGRALNPDGRKVTAKGHVIVRLEDGSWVQEHRKMLENHLGRRLRPTEKVKHVNRDKTDNRLDNFEIWEEVKTWP